MNLAQQIKTCRTGVGLSQTELAEKLMVSRQAVSKWESGKGTPDITNLKAMAELFGVSVDFLMGTTIEGTTPAVVVQAIDRKSLTPHKQPGKPIGSRSRAAVIAAHPRATSITELDRRRPTSRKEKFWEVVFMIIPGTVWGVFQFIDTIHNPDPYFLVEENNRHILARVSKERVESRELPNRVEDKIFHVGEYKFFKRNPVVMN